MVAENLTNVKKHVRPPLRHMLIHKELAPARIKEDIKAVEKLLDLLEDVFTNPWKQDAVFTSLSSGIEATKDVSDELLQAKSRERQAANDFVVNRCSSDATLDYFDPLKKAKLKSFKDMYRVWHVPRSVDQECRKNEKSVYQWWCTI